MEFMKDNVAALQSRIMYIQESLSRIAFLKTSLQGNCSQVRDVVCQDECVGKRVD